VALAGLSERCLKLLMRIPQFRDDSEDAVFGTMHEAVMFLQLTLKS
jgi:hypothetical protein